MNDDIVTAFCILLYCKWSFGVFILWIDVNMPTHFRGSNAHICAFFFFFCKCLLVLFVWHSVQFAAGLFSSVRISTIFCWLNSSIRHLECAHSLGLSIAKCYFYFNGWWWWRIRLLFHFADVCRLLPSLILNCNWAFNYSHSVCSPKRQLVIIYSTVFLVYHWFSCE